MKQCYDHSDEVIQLRCTTLYALNANQSNIKCGHCSKQPGPSSAAPNLAAQPVQLRKGLGHDILQHELSSSWFCPSVAEKQENDEDKERQGQEEGGEGGDETKETVREAVGEDGAVCGRRKPALSLLLFLFFIVGKRSAGDQGRYYVKISLS